MITLAWSKSSLPLSKLIRWMFNEPVSHFSIIFDNRLVFHSNLLGAHTEWLSRFEKKSKIIYRIDLFTNLEQEEKIYKNILNTFDRPISYDWGGFLFFAIHSIFYKFLKRPMPKRNLWSDKDLYLCEEMITMVQDLLNIHPYQDLSIITPYQLFRTIRNQLHFKKQTFKFNL